MSSPLWTPCSAFSAFSTGLRALVTLAGVVGLVTVGLGSPEAAADEGQWMPEQVAELDHAALTRRGLERSAHELWDPAGGGLLRAAVNLSGCSASFVSPQGLILTNHHCAYGALQARSTVDRDLLRDGFLARSPADEEPAVGKTIRIVERIDDVTAEIAAAAASASDDRGRWRAVQTAERALVAACDGEAPGRRCEVASFFGGSQYRRIAYLELEDLRLVYAPPAAIGEFGGEIDNWSWPRHTGDFAILRAYVGPSGEPRAHAADNVPYTPEHWLKVSAEGVAPGELVAVLGYPGHTTRYLWAAALASQIEVGLPAEIDLYGEWIAIAEALGAADPALAIKVAATKKSLANRHKNAQGMLAGIAAGGFLERRQTEEASLAEVDTAGILGELQGLTASRREGARGRFLRGRVASGPTLLGAAVDLVRWAREREKPEAERTRGYLDRDRDPLWRRLERRLRDHDPEVEAHLVAAVVARTLALPPAERSPALVALAGPRPPVDPTREALLPATRRLFRGTTLAGEARLRALFAAEAATLRAASDPLLRAANALTDELEAAEAEEERYRGRLLTLEPAYFELLRRARPGPLYPDANGTLRLSFASVRGYRPRDGLEALPQTTLAGQLAKVTGEEPFALPGRVLEAAGTAATSGWADPELEDLVLCLLSDADTTGGNSGSAVINGRGEVIGLNFDRVWENIAGDVAYQPDRSRNIIVDLRYLFWLLDQVEGATGLLEELGVAEHRGRIRRPSPRPATRAEVTVFEGPAADDTTAESAAQGAGQSADGCACRSAANEPGGALNGLLFGFFGLSLSVRGARRRRRLDAARAPAREITPRPSAQR